MKKLPFDIFMHYFSSKFSEMVITCKFSRKSSCIENFSNTYLVFIWKVQFAEKMQRLWSQRDKTYAFTFKCTECKEVYLIWVFQESLSHNQDNHSLNCVVSLWSQSCLNYFITHGFIKPSSHNDDFLMPFVPLRVHRCK